MRRTAFPLLVLAVAFQFAGPVPASHADEARRGRIVGVVVEAATGNPVAGAYVAVGDFGDSGGSNYARHRQQGLFAKATTDRQGRFVLDGLAFRDHPLIVTHPGFVRHDLTVHLRREAPEPDMRVGLAPAATIDVTVVDSSGEPLEGIWYFRLEALDGRRFIPPGRDPHLSAFASNVWVERPRRRLTSTGFSFTGLHGGEYAIDIMKYTRTDSAAPAPDGMTRMPLDTSTVLYYGGVAHVAVEPGRAAEVLVQPTDPRTSVTIPVPQVPEKLKNMRIPPAVLISRNLGLLLWADGKVHHPEDHRLGRLQRNALYFNPVMDSDVFTIKNLPPGSYSVFGGPMLFMSAARVEVSSGRHVTVDLPAIEPSEQARANLWTFDRKIALERKQHTVSQLCELLSAGTDARPRIVADPSIETEKLALRTRQATIWELLEEVYLTKGWKLTEQDDRTLLLGPEH